MLLPPAEFAAVAGRAGIDDESVVVIYDANWGMAAARVLWGLQAYGHQHVAIVNGGWDRWQEADYPTTTEVTPPTARPFHPSPHA